MDSQIEKDEQRLEQLRDYLTENGHYNLRVVPGRGICSLQEFLFTIGLCEGLDESGWQGRWCYPKAKILESVVALTVWDGKEDPVGDWIKYKGYRGEYDNPKLIKNV